MLSCFLYYQGNESPLTNKKKQKSWSEALLKTGSIHQCQNFDDDEELLYHLNVGKFLPQYKNTMAQSQWEKSLSTVQTIGDLTQNDSSLSQPPLLRKHKSEQCKQENKQTSSNPTYSSFQFKKSEQIPFVYSKEDYLVRKIYLKSQKELMELLILGPPSEYRWSCWKTILLFKKTKNCKNTAYSRSLEQESKDYKEIKKDVDRTLIYHPYFESADANGLGQIQLTRLLNALVNSAKKIGYCQGMNYLGGLFLVVSSCDEFLSYSCLISLIYQSKYMLFFLYCHQMPLHDILVHITHHQVNKNFPLMYKNITKRDIPDSFWCSKMIISIFLYNLDLEQSVRAWDYIISRGTVQAIPELIVSILYSMEKQLEKGSFDVWAQAFSCHQKSYLNIGQVIYNAKKKFRIEEEEIPQIMQSFKPKNERQEKVQNAYLLFNQPIKFKESVKQLFEEYS